jgi:CBS domain containing-hemolysin-like protein
MRANLDDAILTCLLGTNLSNVLASAITTAVLSALLGARGEGLAVLAGLAGAGGLRRDPPQDPVPRVSRAVDPGHHGRVARVPLDHLAGTLGPEPLRAMVARVMGDQHTGMAELDRRGLANWLSRSTAERGEARFHRIMVRFLQLSNHRIDELMRPLSVVVCVPAGVTLGEALEVAASSGHSRLPVQGTDGDLDGYLLVRDLLLIEGRVRSQEPVPGELVRSLLLVDGALSPYELFEELHARGAQLASVVDRQGRAMGVITLEDLIEKVTGAIADEFDPPEDRS